MVNFNDCLLYTDHDYIVPGVNHYIYRFDNSFGASVITWATANDTNFLSNYYNDYEVAILRWPDGPDGPHTIIGDNDDLYPDWDVYHFRTETEMRAFLGHIKSFDPKTQLFRSYFSDELSDQLVYIPD
jgi:hypothetical protein